MKVGQTRVFLTLNVPNRGLAAGTPVVASYNSQLLRLFKQHVLQDWQHRIENARDDTLAQVDKLEFEKLKATLDLLIPERANDGQQED